MLVDQMSQWSFIRVARGAALSACALTLLAACSSDTSPVTPTERDGTAVKVGQGSAYAYVVTGPSGTSSIGVALTPSALDGLPSSDAEWMLPLPAGVATGPFDHVMINWNAMGHPPAMYMTPHFDFHFYTITPAAQSAIQGGNDLTPVPPSQVPPDYISGVQAVPDMGVHWVDTTSDEFHGQPFDRTFIYGFYHGSMVFVEPMVTRAFLQSQPNATDVVKQPQSFAQPGRYPTHYSVRMDAATNTIRVSLDSLAAR
jgi:hypothetical protein